MPNKYKQFSKNNNNPTKPVFLPEAILDYHKQGPLTEYDITRQFEEFIEESYIQGKTQLLIITGKGINSKNGPVIKPLVMRLLQQCRDIESFNMANENNGGEGAFEATLSERKL